MVIFELFVYDGLPKKSKWIVVYIQLSFVAGMGKKQYVTHVLFSIYLVPQDIHSMFVAYNSPLLKSRRAG